MSTADDPLERARERLYAGPRASFLERRKELAAGVRGDGDAAAAKEIARLRKPSVAAHSLNLLAHDDDEALTELLDLGARVRAAFATGDDARMRELLQQRNGAVTATTKRARAIVGEEGESVSAATADQIAQTLRAAMATDEAADLVRRGVLTDALDEPGFAALGVGPAVTRRSAGATPNAPDHAPAATTGGAKVRGRASTRATAGDTAAQRAARRDAELAVAETAAVQALDDAEARHAALAEQRDGLAAQRDDLAERLAAIEEQLAEAERLLADAAKDRRRAERVVETARRARRR